MCCSGQQRRPICKLRGGLVALAQGAFARLLKIYKSEDYKWKP